MLAPAADLTDLGKKKKNPIFFLFFYQFFEGWGLNWSKFKFATKIRCFSNSVHLWDLSGKSC